MFTKANPYARKTFSSMKGHWGGGGCPLFYRRKYLSPTIWEHAKNWKSEKYETHSKTRSYTCRRFSFMPPPDYRLFTISELSLFVFLVGFFVCYFCVVIFVCLSRNFEVCSPLPPFSNTMLHAWWLNDCLRQQFTCMLGVGVTQLICSLIS